MTPKIATCCYCGTRAALVLKTAGRHELACRACGAPLHDLKMLKADHPGKPGVVKPSPIRGRACSPGPKQPKKRRKSRKGGFARWFRDEILDDAIDLIEDLFD